MLPQGSCPVTIVSAIRLPLSGTLLTGTVEGREFFIPLSLEANILILQICVRTSQRTLPDALSHSSIQLCHFQYPLSGVNSLQCYILFCISNEAKYFSLDDNRHDKFNMSNTTLLIFTPKACSILDLTNSINDPTPLV